MNINLLRTTFLCVFLLSVLGSYINAVPAIPTPITITQPDGTKLTILLKGDENFNYATTLDGYLIKENSNGFYCYATVNDKSELVRSDVRVNDKIGRAHV